MWITILEWLIGWVLKYLADKASNAAIDAKKDAEREKERAETNQQNVEKYEAAQTRADRIRAATDLLNGVRRP